VNVGIVTTWFERGAAYVSRQYQQSLEKSGAKVFIFARGEDNAKGNPLWDRANVHWAKTWPLTDATKMQVHDFKNWLHKNKIELVIFNEQRDLWPIAVCQSLGVRTVAYIDYYRSNSVAKFSCYDGLICNTKRHYSVFAWHPGALYLPWGTDTDLFQPPSDHPKLVNDGVVTFFHSAGQSNRKGTDLLIEAFSKMPASGKLIIHTQKKLQDMFPQQDEIACKLESEGRLKVITETVPAPGLYHMGDVYVYPTKLEGIGLTVCEAMSCGLASIVPDNAPMNEFVENNETSLLVNVDSFVARHDGYYWPMCFINIEDLAKKMAFCARNLQWVISAKKKARAKMLRDHNWETNSATLLDYLDSLEVQGQQIAVTSFCKRMANRMKYISDV